MEGAPQGYRAAQGAKVGQGHPWGGEGRLAPQSPVSRLRPVGESLTPLPSQSGVMMAISCACPPFPDTVLSLPQKQSHVKRDSGIVDAMHGDSQALGE